MMGSKKHKKHKSEKRDRYEEKQFAAEKPPALKLILKVGTSTPEHSSDSPGPNIPLVQPNNFSVTPAAGDEESRHSTASFHGREENHLERQHKKAKKKKKKKEKDRDKHEKKHKHHHKEKRKRPKDESSQDDISIGEESLSDPPLPKRIAMDVTNIKAGDSINTDGMHHAAGGVSAVSREPRSCVLRQRQERSPLQKLLDYLLKGLEKRDPQQFFAWPVTDHIAPGYSQIIQQPMDFSTMKQKIDDNQYSTLNEYIEDFKLMCNNAMVYNHPETIYYKAAKKLLHVGLKMMSPEKLKPLYSVLTYIGELTQEELGFDLGLEEINQVPVKTEPSDDHAVAEEEDGSDAQRGLKKKLKEPRTIGKFEAIPDDLTAEEILEQAKQAAQAAADRLTLRHPNTKMGFLRQRKDGSTSLAILVPSDGVLPGTNERPVSLGMLTGKLTHGTGQLQGFREDRRNLAKTVKPLYYGAFGSYAPSYDSTFANLTKEESDLVYQTYGDETCVQYAESILDFSKDCDYTMTMVDNLLDLLTGGEHRKTKRILEERRKLREEEDRIRQLLEGKSASSQDEKAPSMQASDVKVDFNSLKSLSDFGIDVKFLDTFEEEIQLKEDQRLAEEAFQSRLDHTSTLLQKLQQAQNDRLSVTPPAHLSQVAHPSESEVQLLLILLNSLLKKESNMFPTSVTRPSLIPTMVPSSFSEEEIQLKEDQRLAEEAFQSRLDHTSTLLQKLQQAQNDRLSVTPPAHLSQVAHPSESEVQLAEKITESLKDMAKKVEPGAVAPVTAIRKAIGIVPEPDIVETDSKEIEGRAATVCEESSQENASIEVSVVLGDSVPSETAVEEVDVEGTSSQAEPEEEPGEVPDLESELREFLESEPALSNSPLHDDRTIEEILSES